MLLYGCPAGPPSDFCRLPRLLRLWRRSFISATCPFCPTYKPREDHAVCPACPACLACPACSPYPHSPGIPRHPPASGSRWGVSINFPTKASGANGATIGFQLIFFVGARNEMLVSILICACVLLAPIRSCSMFKPKIAIPERAQDTNKYV